MTENDITLPFAHHTNEYVCIVLLLIALGFEIKFKALPVSSKKKLYPNSPPQPHCFLPSPETRTKMNLMYMSVPPGHVFLLLLHLRVAINNIQPYFVF